MKKPPGTRISNRAAEELLVPTFSEHCNSGIYVMKFRLLHHVIEDLLELDTLSVVETSSFEQYHLHVTHAYR